MMGALLGLLLVAADPCAPVTLATAPDPETAAVYRKTGDDERAAGGADTATVAYRNAAALDSGDAASRRALQSLCVEARAPSDPFQVGLGQMEAHEWRSAAASFGQVRRADGDLSAALLEGICNYQMGHDAAAEPLLRSAEARPEHRDLARFYLGLVALRGGEAARASSLFAAAAVNPTLGALAADLSRLARLDGRLVVSFLAESGFDTNVPLAPRGASTTGGATGGMTGGGPGGTMNGDGLYGLGASVLLRPSGLNGPYLRGGGSLRQQLRLGTYDLGGAEAAAGWQVSREGRGAIAEYAYSFRTFGGSPFLSSHRLAAAGWVPGGGLTWSARYAAQLEDYRSPTLAGFSGLLHRAEVRAALPFAMGNWVAVVYGASRDAAKLGITSFTEHGPRVELRALLSPRLRLGAVAGLSFRAYDAFDTVIGATRTDRYLDAAALTEYDLASGWTARLSLEGRKALSNAPALEYDKLVPMIGIAWQMGL